MNTTILTITCAPDITPEAADLEHQLRELIGKENVHFTESKSFGGWSELIIVLSIGGGVAIKEIGSIVRTWIERHKTKKANLAKMEFTGYSASELKKIVQSSLTSDSEKTQ